MVYVANRDDNTISQYAVNLDAKVIMARAPASLREKLRDRGYSRRDDLDPFILSGGPPTATWTSTRPSPISRTC